MRRLVAALLLAWLGGAGLALAGEDKEFAVRGKLTKEDLDDAGLKDPNKVHPYKMKANTIYVIDLSSSDFDTFLLLKDEGGKEVANDDDGGGGLNSRIVTKIAKDGAYKIVVTTYDGKVGNYSLKVRTGTEEDLAKADPFYPLLGKPAPEVVLTQSFNGDVKKLSDLKGKVVLLDFWAVWCGPCIRTFPHLREWNDDYKEKGLVVLGVTTYFEQLGFDKEAGKVKLVAKKVKDEKTGDVKLEGLLTKDQEHDMIKDFAAFHKLNYRLATVSMDGWKKMGEDYQVRGIPHAVLIDRQGNIRMVRVGADPANAIALEAEIEKLLAEK